MSDDLSMFYLGQVTMLERKIDTMRAGIQRLLNDMDANGRLSDCSFGGSCISAEVDKRLLAILNGTEGR